MEPISIVFDTSFGLGMPAPDIPYDWSIVTVYFNTYVNHLASRAQSLRNISSMCETLPDQNF